MEMHWNWPSHWIAIVSLVIINHIQSPTKAWLYRLYTTQQKRHFYLRVCSLLVGYYCPLFIKEETGAHKG